MRNFIVIRGKKALPMG